MKTPNFFILGAPKCGTTSLAAWLSGHPNVFMSPVKEPNFFNSDMKREWSHIGDAASYDMLYREAGAEHQAVGEATVWSLFSDVAVPNILTYSPDAKFIVMLRNPVDMVRSLHEEMVHAGLQKKVELKDALDAQAQQEEGTPRAGRILDRRHVDYISCCSLAWQLDRLFRRVPSSRVHLVRMEDMRAEPDRVFGEVCEFLGVARVELAEYEAHNRGRKLRSQRVKKLLNALLRLKYRLNIRRSFLIGGLIQRLNTVVAPREELPCEERHALEVTFQDDNALLATLIQQTNLASRYPNMTDTN